MSNQLFTVSISKEEMARIVNRRVKEALNGVAYLRTYGDDSKSRPLDVEFFWDENGFGTLAKINLRDEYIKLFGTNSDHYSSFMLDTVAELRSLANEIELIYKKKVSIFNKTVVELPLSSSTKNCLVDEKVDTVKKLILLSKQNLESIPNLGKIRIKEITTFLLQNDLQLAKTDCRKLNNQFLFDSKTNLSDRLVEAKILLKENGFNIQNPIKGKFHFDNSLLCKTDLELSKIYIDFKSGMPIQSLKKKYQCSEVFIVNACDRYRDVQEIRQNLILHFQKDGNSLTNAPIELLKLKTRTLHCLKSIKGQYIQDILKFSYNDLLKLHRLGSKSLDELVYALAAIELKLKE